MTTQELHSAWLATVHMPDCPALVSDTRADVCIIGAGMAGLTCAYLLTRAGRSVVVLDDGALAHGMTGFTTAHLSNVLGHHYYELEHLHGETGARLVAQSHLAAINRIGAITRTERIACDFGRLDGFLFLPPGGDGDLIDVELAAARRAGLMTVEDVAHVPWSTFDTGRCLRFPDQGQLHPLKYLAALARAIERRGGRLYSGTHADSVEGGTPARVHAGGHLVMADAVIVATNTPVNDRLALHTKQSAYMSYVIAMRVPRGALPHVLAWDTEDPYHYLRLQRLGDEELLIVGGEDHKTGQADDTEQRHGRLEAWTRERFPMAGALEFAWSGQVMESVDGLAFIGRNPGDENVYVVTGDSGNGLTHGTIAGLLITDLIEGRTNAWAELYDPSRKPIRGAGTFAKEALNSAAQYRDWLTRGDVGSIDEIPRDSGAIVRRGLHKLAVYRDEQGAVHELSATCPHLGGVVRWNAEERTWDCPCHGSRFDRRGKLFHGPANSDLKRAEK